MSDSAARKRLLGILSGSWVAQGLFGLVELGVPELLADGPRPASELAAATGADEQALARLLRALALMGLLSQPSPGVFGLTATTELLRRDAADSVRDNVLMQGDHIFRSFAEITHTLRTGQPAFERVYGQPFWDYLGDHPDAAAVFNRSMGDQRPPNGLATCDLTGTRTLVDVGGGNGELLIQVLAENPDIRGALLELPDACAAARKRFAEAGFADRADAVAGSFFETVPAGADAYVLARVLHNWDDERAARILRACRAAMTTGARLIVLEELLPETPPAGLSAAAIVDLLMLVTLPGRDRTATEYHQLLTSTGFEVAATRDGVVEALAA